MSAPWETRLLCPWGLHSAPSGVYPVSSIHRREGAAACDADGMPRCAHVAVRLASGRPHRPTAEPDGAEARAVNALVEVFGQPPLSGVTEGSPVSSERRPT